MLRNIIENTGKACPATYKAAAAAKTGMGAVANLTAGTVGFPSAETADNIVVLKKEKYPTGRNASVAEYSDYDAEFNAIAKDEIAAFESYVAGEQFATDQYNATNVKATNAGKRVSVGTDGKWDIAATTVASKYTFVKIISDNGHDLALIAVTETATKNS